MKRGEIWLADLGYVGKVRPVLILSGMTGQQTAGESRLVRGGNWNNNSGNLASSNRNNNSSRSGESRGGGHARGMGVGR